VHVLTLLLSLPFMLALALGLHAGIARIAKTFVAASRPLATGETEAYGYERRVYHTAQFRELARWWSKDNSIRWVLVDFRTTVRPFETKQFFLTDVAGEVVRKLLA